MGDFGCPRCDKVFTTWQEADRHNSNEHYIPKLEEQRDKLLAACEYALEKTGVIMDGWSTQELKRILEVAIKEARGE